LLEVHLEKATPGEVFENLDLLANVVGSKKSKQKKKVSVEVVGEEGKVIVEEEAKEQSIYNYGFGRNYSNVLDDLEEEVA
jgi:hypothetical protein